MGAEEINALQGVNFQLEEKAFLALGVHLAQVIHTSAPGSILDLPQKEKLFSMENVSKLSGKEQFHLRRTEIGFAFQRFNLTLTVNC